MKEKEMKRYALRMFISRDKSAIRDLEGELGKLFDNHNMRRRWFSMTYEANGVKAELKRKSIRPFRERIYMLVCDVKASTYEIGNGIGRNLAIYANREPFRGVLHEIEIMGPEIFSIESS